MHYWDKRTVLVLAPDTTYPRHSEGAFIRLKDGGILFAYSRFYSGWYDDSACDLVALRSAAPYQKGKIYVTPRPCIDCGREFKPLRRGRCWSCSERVRPGGRFNHA